MSQETIEILKNIGITVVVIFGILWFLWWRMGHLEEDDE